MEWDGVVRGGPEKGDIGHVGKPKEWHVHGCGVVGGDKGCTDIVL